MSARVGPGKGARSLSGLAPFRAQRRSQSSRMGLRAVSSTSVPAWETVGDVPSLNLHVQ
jgi:hypothetical protein